ncbi:PREDICTED: anaphase-promoting complex subunit 5 [Rhagoletis zephyria]|uniref:anaphase-promoting complex subunit 5 n=1 Tax=Rhagoletis zephyria TaxID=28612 RepID=UPI0008113E60|nr:PREDICTED: anaphase-promoting complex subunit 5 [Rhagoletis zephyria]XP_036341507.1 anaphase-promoting complex subunit 5 [Rhagoletis pomonella]
MQSSTLKRAPVLCKFKFLASRMRQLFKFGKAKQLQHANINSRSNNNNNNCEFENNNNNNNELSKLTFLLTSEMAQNAANEWLLQQAANVNATAIGYGEDMEQHVICLQTEAGHFYWNAAAMVEQQGTQQLNEIDWK